MTILPLTKLDIKAIREADRVCFDYDRRESGHQIRLIREAKQDSGWSRPDSTYTLDVEGRLDGFVYEGGYDYYFDTKQMYRCFQMIHTPSMTEVWKTVIALLKVGDILRLIWVANSNNDYIRQAGLTHDTLGIAIVRGGKAIYTFDIGDSITPKDSSARMIHY